MFINIAHLIRLAAGEIEFKTVTPLKAFLTELTKKDPHLRKTPMPEFIAAFEEAMKPVVGHGLSQDKYDEMIAVVKSKHSLMDAVQYLYNFTMKGILDPATGTDLGVKYAADRKKIKDLLANAYELMRTDIHDHKMIELSTIIRDALERL